MKQQFVHIADSVPSDGNNNSPKGDNTWLGVTANVWRGRSTERHEWCVPGGSEHKIAVVHIVGNDFKSKGSVVSCVLHVHSAAAFACSTCNP